MREREKRTKASSFDDESREDDPSQEDNTCLQQNFWRRFDFAIFLEWKGERKETFNIVAAKDKRTLI